MLVVLSTAAAYFYHQYREREEHFINGYYFQTLHEATSELNMKLDQLVRVHAYNESNASKLALFPSYAAPEQNGDKKAEDAASGNTGYCEPKPAEGNENGNKTVATDTDCYQLTLDGNKVVVKKSPVRKIGSAEITDVIPQPKNGFVLYLLVGSDNKVLSSIGGERVLSIVDTADINLQIHEQRNQNWINLVSKPDQPPDPGTLGLPGYSYNIDMELTSGPARLFIYPFKVDARLSLPADGKDVKVEHSTLYLVGVLPKKMLDMREDKRWNLSLLLISLVLLMFAWTMFRLFMLSPNQPVGDFFYLCTVFFSYTLFVLVTSWLIAYGELNVERDNEQRLARQLIEHVQVKAENELHEIFSQLDNYRTYYTTLLMTMNGSCKLNDYTPETLIPSWLQSASGACSAVSKALLTFPTDSVFRTHIQGITLRNGKRFRLDAGNERYEELETPAVDSTKTPESSDKEQNRNLVNLYGEGVKFISTRPYGEWFDPGAMADRHAHRILGVFLMDNKGRQILPTFHYIEINKPPTSYNLSHRDYFKKVRDHQGWTATVCGSGQWREECSECTDKGSCEDTDDSAGEGRQDPCTQASVPIREDNFYIQRLLNINNGTRGTTLGMPLIAGAADSGKDAADISNLKDKILGADIVLSSLTLTEWTKPEELQDMIVMVVDRLSGEVLFHMDDDRAMVENLFHAGQETMAIRQKIGVNKRTVSKAIAGFYHGDPGSFLAAPLPIDQWALVVFIPDNNTDSYMTNLFLANSLSMGGVLILVAFGLYVIKRFFATGLIKRRLDIPLVINSRMIMIFSSVFVASVSMGYWLGSAMDRSDGTRLIDNSTVTFPLLAMVSCLLWGLYAVSRQLHREPVVPKRGAVVLTVVFLLFGTLLTTYLHYIGREPIGALHTWYYTKVLYPARLNQEFQELQKIALGRYPNSITRYQVAPLKLMSISKHWEDKLAGTKTVATPDTIGHFSQLTYSTGPLAWVGRYLFSVGIGSSSDNSENDFPRGPLAPQHMPLMIIYFLILSVVWVIFHHRVLSVRLFGSTRFLRHLNQLAQRKPAGKLHITDPRLLIDLAHNPSGGQNLGLLLHQLKLRKSQDSPPDELDILVSVCPLLEHAATCDYPFPCMKIKINKVDQTRSVHMWDIEDCLNQAEQRDILLRLINQFRSLRISGELNEFTLYIGFHTLERLLLKANTLKTTDVDEQHMSSREYTAWAETFMDFRVQLPDDLLEHVDRQFIQKECDEFPLLRNLPGELPVTDIDGPTSPLNETRWINLRDRQKTDAEWASINYILMKAGALFRFKWESCSSAEKLALYHLAQHGRINPANTQMLEQLALEGLIKVRRGRIRIINNSFAYFVRHAEDARTRKDLVQRGEVGAWQDYRLPVTMLILLVIVAIALTSGSSLYMIAASVLGLLGAIGTITSSTRLIRDNLEK